MGQTDRRRTLGALAAVFMLALGAPGAHAQADRCLSSACRFDEALALAESIADPARRDSALEDIVVSLAAAARYDQAAALAGRLPPGPADRAIGAVGRAAARAGDAARARRAFAAIRVQGTRDHMLAASAGPIARAGIVDAALDFAGAIADPRLRVQAFRDVLAAPGVDGPAREAAVDGALAALAHVDPQDLRLATIDLARALAAAGRAPRALALAAGSLRDPVLAAVAVALARAGQPGPALDVARTIGAAPSGVEALVAVAVAMRAANDAAQGAALFAEAAAVVAGMAPGSVDQLTAALRIVEGRAAAGDLDLAAQLARADVLAPWRGLALVRVVQAAAEAGDVAQAERLVGTIAGAPKQDGIPAKDLAAAFGWLAVALAPVDPARMAAAAERAMAAAAQVPASDRELTVSLLRLDAINRRLVGLMQAYRATLGSDAARAQWDRWTVEAQAHGDVAAADVLARAIADPMERAGALALVAAGVERQERAQGRTAPPALSGPLRDALAGTHWVVVGPGDARMPLGQRLSFAARPGGTLQVHGLAGCNVFNAEAQAGPDDALRIVPGAISLRGCLPHVAAAERWFLGVLGTVRRAVTGPGTLALHDEAGRAALLLEQR